MLESGRYKAEEEGDFFHAYRYVIEVKETEKSYIFKLLEAQNRYAYDHLDLLFKGRVRVVIPRNKPTHHAVRVWSERDFTIYPFQSGIPFYFRKESADSE